MILIRTSFNQHILNLPKMSLSKFVVTANVPKDNGVNFGKRKRDPPEYTCLTKPEQTENFIRKCRKGEVKPKLILFDKEDYILRHRQRTSLGWLKKDKCTLWEVEYMDEDGQETGKLTGKFHLNTVKKKLPFFWRIK